MLEPAHARHAENEFSPVLAQSQPSDAYRFWKSICVCKTFIDLGMWVGINHDLIVSEVSTLLDDPEAYDKMSKAVNPYGDGKACGRIVDALR